MAGNIAEDGGGSEMLTDDVRSSQPELYSEGARARTDKQGDPVMPPEVPSQATSGPLVGNIDGLSPERKHKAPETPHVGGICSNPDEDDPNGAAAAADTQQQESMPHNGSEHPNGDSALVGSMATLESDDGPGPNNAAPDNPALLALVPTTSPPATEAAGKCSDPAPSSNHGDDSPITEEGTLELASISNEAPRPAQPLSADADGTKANDLEGRETLPLHKLPTLGLECTPKPEDAAACSVDPIEAAEFVAFDMDEEEDKVTVTGNNNKEQGEAQRPPQGGESQCSPPGPQADATLDAVASNAAATTDDASKKSTGHTAAETVEAHGTDDQQAPMIKKAPGENPNKPSSSLEKTNKESPEGTPGAAEGVPVPPKEASGSADGAAAPVAGENAAAKPKAAQQGSNSSIQSAPSSNQPTAQQQMLRNAALAALAAQQKHVATGVKKPPLKGAADKKLDKEKSTKEDTKLGREKERKKSDRDRSSRKDREKDRSSSRHRRSSERKRSRDEDGRGRSSKRDDKEKDEKSSSSRGRESRRRGRSPPGGVSWTVWTAREKEKDEAREKEKEKTRQKEQEKEKTRQKEQEKEKTRQKEKERGEMDAAAKDALLRGPLGSRLQSRSKEGGPDPVPPQKSSLSWQQIAQTVDGRRRGEAPKEAALRAPSAEEQRMKPEDPEEELVWRQKALKDLRILLGDLFARSASQCDDEAMKTDHPEYGAISLGHLKGTFRTIHKYPIDAKRMGFLSLSTLISSEFRDMCFQVEGDVIPNSEPPKNDKLLIPHNIALYREKPRGGAHLGRPVARSPSPPRRGVLMTHQYSKELPSGVGGGARPEVGMMRTTTMPVPMRDPPDPRLRSEVPEAPTMNHLRRGGMMRSPSPGSSDAYGGYNGRQNRNLSPPPRDGRQQTTTNSNATTMRPARVDERGLPPPPRDAARQAALLRPLHQPDDREDRGRPLYQPPQRRVSQDGGRGDLMRDDPRDDPMAAARTISRGGSAMMAPSRQPVVLRAEQSPPPPHLRPRLVGSSSSARGHHDFDDPSEYVGFRRRHPPVHESEDPGDPASSYWHQEEEQRLVRVRMPPNEGPVRTMRAPVMYEEDAVHEEHQSRMVAARERDDRGVPHHQQEPQHHQRRPARRGYAADDFEDDYDAYERPSAPLRLPLRLPRASLPTEEVEPYEPEFVTTPAGTPGGYGVKLKRPRAEEEQGPDDDRRLLRQRRLEGDQKRFRAPEGSEYVQQPLREAALAQRLSRVSQQGDDRSFPDVRHHHQQQQQQQPRHHQTQREEVDGWQRRSSSARDDAEGHQRRQPVVWCPSSPPRRGGNDVDHAPGSPSHQGTGARRIVYIPDDGPLPPRRAEEHGHRDRRPDTSPVRVLPPKKLPKAVSDLRTLLLDKLKLGRPYRMSLVLQDFLMRFSYRFKKDSLGQETLGGVLDKYCSDIVMVKTTVEGGHKEILPVSPAALDSPVRRPPRQLSPSWPPPRQQERPSSAGPSRARQPNNQELDLRSFLSEVVRNKLNADGFYHPSKLVPDFLARFGYKPDFQAEGYRKLADYVSAVAGDIVECIVGKPPRTHCEIRPARRR